MGRVIGSVAGVPATSARRTSRICPTGRRVCRVRVDRPPRRVAVIDGPLVGVQPSGQAGRARAGSRAGSAPTLAAGRLRRHGPGARERRSRRARCGAGTGRRAAEQRHQGGQRGEHHHEHRPKDGGESESSYGESSYCRGGRRHDHAPPVDVGPDMSTTAEAHVVRPGRDQSIGRDRASLRLATAAVRAGAGASRRAVPRATPAAAAAPRRAVPTRPPPGSGRRRPAAGSRPAARRPVLHAR
ncbi:MAG: hypothetical protein QOE19_755 [Actinomycetota bacterium]|nr:hypothetical protein [Actinomycetota bacterium]